MSHTDGNDMIKNSSKPSDGYSESPSSRPMTLRQQLDDILSYLDEESVYPLRMSKIEVRAAIEALCQEIAREARIDENQRWANGYSSAILDNPTITDVAGLRAAKGDFEDRIRQLTQKPPQPQGADSHTDIGDTVSGNEADNREEVADE